MTLSLTLAQSVFCENLTEYLISCNLFVPVNSCVCVWVCAILCILHIISYYSRKYYLDEGSLKLDLGCFVTGLEVYISLLCMRK